MSINKYRKSWQIDYFDSISRKRVRKAGFKTKNEAKVALYQAMVNNIKGITNVTDKNILSTNNHKNKEKQAWQ